MRVESPVLAVLPALLIVEPEHFVVLEEELLVVADKDENPQWSLYNQLSKNLACKLAVVGAIENVSNLNESRFGVFADPLCLDLVVPL